jgi:hypothetical protein
MKKVSLIAALSLSLVFVSGAAVGALAYHLYRTKTVVAKAPKSPDEYRRSYMTEMTTRLDLTADQVSKLNGILDETRVKFREFRERTRPEIKQIHEAQRERIKSMLSNEQLSEYEKMLQEREDRQKNRVPGC